jgi:hypothetical protein
MASVLMPSTLDQIEYLYGTAVAHVAWLKRNDTGQQYLVFCMVELLPAEIPPPPNEEPVTKKTEGGTIHLERSVLSVSAARQWYESARSGACLPLGNRGEPALLLDPLADEPPWPELALRRTAAPFVPALGYDARIHHLLSLAEADSFPWPSVAAKNDTVRSISEWFHFDLAQYDEYLGSLTLIAHNPVIRKVSTRPTQAENGQNIVLLRVEGRDTCPIAEVSVIVNEERPTTQLSRLFDASVDATHEIKHGREEGAVGVSIYHSVWGLLYKAPPLHFLKSVGMNITTSPPDHVVSTPEGGYVVPQRTPRETKLAQLEHATHKLNRAANSRKNTRATPSSQFMADSRPKARQYLRQLMHRAEHRLWIVDPYFREFDVDEFLLATGTPLVEVKVLGSALGFQDQRPEEKELEPTAQATRRHEHATRVCNRIARLAESGWQNPIEVKVMLGRRSPYFHDRFVIVDETAWSLGGSLSDLGDRVSIVLEVPDPTDVLSHFDTCWEKSMRLSDWIHQGQSGDEGP